MLRRQIENALKRAPELDANQVEVAVTDDKVILRGSVRSWAERREAELAAWCAPGVGAVQDQLSVAAQDKRNGLLPPSVLSISRIQTQSSPIRGGLSGSRHG